MAKKTKPKPPPPAKKPKAKAAGRKKRKQQPEDLLTDLDVADITEKYADGDPDAAEQAAAEIAADNDLAEPAPAKLREAAVAQFVAEEKAPAPRPPERRSFVELRHLPVGSRFLMPSVRGYPAELGQVQAATAWGVTVKLRNTANETRTLDCAPGTEVLVSGADFDREFARLTGTAPKAAGVADGGRVAAAPDTAGADRRPNARVVEGGMSTKERVFREWHRSGRGADPAPLIAFAAGVVKDGTIRSWLGSWVKSTGYPSLKGGPLEEPKAAKPAEKAGEPQGSKKRKK